MSDLVPVEEALHDGALGHWSASRFMTFELCPREFEKVYVLGERGEPSEAMLFGSAVHQGLEAHFNGADGVASFRGFWKAVKDDRADPKLTGVGMDLIELVVQQGWSGEAEYVFALDTTASWGYPTVGAIDLIDVSGLTDEARQAGAGGIVVRDFKTTTGTWGWDRARRDIWQPALYCAAVHARYDVWPDFEYAVLNKVQRDLSLFRLTPDETWACAEEAQERARVIVDRVAGGDFACIGKHGDCLECGARFDHDHVCDLNVRAPRISSATREARAR